MNLDPKSKKKMSLVSKRMREILNKASLWSDVDLSKKKIGEEGIMAVFETKFREVEKLCLGNISEEEYRPLFQHLARNRPFFIQYLNLTRVSLTEVTLKNLSKVLIKVKKITLCAIEMTTTRWSSLFTHISKATPMAVETLELKNIHFKKTISGILIGEALARVKYVKLHRIHLDERYLDMQQWKGVFQGIVAATIRVVEKMTLTMPWTNLNYPPVMFEALSLIKCLVLPESIYNFRALFREMNRSRVVKSLTLSTADLSHHTPDPNMAPALAHLDHLKLYCCELDISRWEDLFEEMANADMKEIELTKPKTKSDGNFSGVDAIVLGKGLSSVTRVKLEDCDFTKSQWKSLFREIVKKKPTQVKELDVPYKASRVVSKELWVEVMRTVPKIFCDGFLQNRE